VISVALKTHLEIKLGNCIYKTSLLHRPDHYIGFTPSCPPHILQQNCAHDLKYVSSHFLALAIELHLVRFKLGACFTFELHCSLPSTPSLLLLFRFTSENMLFCFIWLDSVVKCWVSHRFVLFPRGLNSSSSL